MSVIIPVSIRRTDPARREPAGRSLRVGDPQGLGLKPDLVRSNIIYNFVTVVIITTVTKL